MMRNTRSEGPPQYDTVRWTVKQDRKVRQGILLRRKVISDFVSDPNSLPLPLQGSIDPGDINGDTVSDPMLRYYLRLKSAINELPPQETGGSLTRIAMVNIYATSSDPQEAKLVKAETPANIGMLLKAQEPAAL